MSTLTRADYISALWLSLPFAGFVPLGNLLVSLTTHLSFFRPLNLLVAFGIAFLLFGYAFTLRLLAARRRHLRFARFLAQHPEVLSSLQARLSTLKTNLKAEADLLASVRSGLHSL
jgi:hypothetical protein